jgi:hypothetical protein
VRSAGWLPRTARLVTKPCYPAGCPFVEGFRKNIFLWRPGGPWDNLKVGVTVLEFQQGEPPEAIRSHYPTLSLEQVYGAITFYLGHKSEVENDIAEREREEDAYSAAHPTPPDIKAKFGRMRQQMLSRRS